jgi:CheY-like chemotaxis protein
MRRTKILVVEDDRPTRLLLSKLLTNNGYDVVEAEHGMAAAKLLQEGLVPCLILTDWIMPGNGADLIKKLRANDVLILIPIVITTGTPELAETIELHGIKILKKPVVDETILALVKEHVERSSKGSS